jgi:hypothetical protein
VPSPTTPTLTAAILSVEEAAAAARREGMKLSLFAALVLLAVCGALAEVARGRRPALARRPE